MNDQDLDQDLDHLPRDPDWDDVPQELRLLSELNYVTVISEDGVSRDTLAVNPALFAHARRLREDAEED